MKQLPLLGIELLMAAPRLLKVLVLTALVGWLSLTIVHAQVDTVQLQPRLDTQIEAIKTEYRAELETYRDLERQSAIANQQYAQLQTLVSLETAITTLQKTMKSRAHVLDLYMQLLRLELTQAPGVELTTKNALIAELDTSLADIASHKLEVEQADDRETLAAVGASFTPLGTRLESLAYTVQSQLTIARLQTVYDKVLVVKEEVKTQTAETTPVLQMAARDRAFAETDRNLEEVRAELSLLQFGASSEKLQRNSFGNLVRDAGSVYAGLAQSINFLSELAGVTFNDI